MNESLSNNLRRVISNIDAWVLSDAYNYSLQLPCNTPELNFMADLNSTTGVLTIFGDREAADDILTLRRQGASLEVGIDGCWMDFSFASVTSVPS